MALAQKKKKRAERKRRVTRSPQAQALDTAAILERIDEMLRELHALREQLAQTVKPPQPVGLTQQLFGALGHGTWDEYDMDFEWKRFSEWDFR